MVHAVLSQKNRFAANFGTIHRAAATFYCRQDQGFRTTITFLDYWRIKRGIAVAVHATIRDLHGAVVLESEIAFRSGPVAAFSPCESLPSFEGSVEVVVTSQEDLVYPFPAIIAVYEASRSVSFVHTYGRAYGPAEIEAGRTIDQGEESGWTLRDTQTIRSFAIVHNGREPVPEQRARLVVRSAAGASRETEFQIPRLAPYATHRIAPQTLFSSLPDFLNGQPGDGNLSFRLGQAFPRMLVGNETVDGSEFQVTHSNFNWTRLRTEAVDFDEGFMEVPRCGFRNQEVVVYPDCPPGDHSATHGGRVWTVRPGRRQTIATSGGTIAFRSQRGPLPARIVTALSARHPTDGSELPFECSLGIFHAGRPKKHSHWALVCIGGPFRSRIIVQSLDKIYGPFKGRAEFRLFRSDTFEVRERTITSEEIGAFEGGWDVCSFFDLEPATERSLAFVYVSAPDYGGLALSTTLESESGALAFEHSF